jgi:hypothetical protein
MSRIVHLSREDRRPADCIVRVDIVRVGTQLHLRCLWNPTGKYRQ